MNRTVCDSQSRSHRCQTRVRRLCSDPTQVVAGAPHAAVALADDGLLENAKQRRFQGFTPRRWQIAAAERVDLVGFQQGELREVNGRGAAAGVCALFHAGCADESRHKLRLRMHAMGSCGTSGKRACTPWHPAPAHGVQSVFACKNSKTEFESRSSRCWGCAACPWPDVLGNWPTRKMGPARTRSHP